MRAALGVNPVLRGVRGRCVFRDGPRAGRVSGLHGGGYDGGGLAGSQAQTATGGVLI